jgi:hypothetical protein
MSSYDDSASGLRPNSHEGIRNEVPNDPRIFPPRYSPEGSYYSSNEDLDIRIRRRPSVRRYSRSSSPYTVRERVRVRESGRERDEREEYGIYDRARSPVYRRRDGSRSYIVSRSSSPGKTDHRYIDEQRERERERERERRRDLSASPSPPRPFYFSHRPYVPSSRPFVPPPRPSYYSEIPHGRGRGRSLPARVIINNYEGRESSPDEYRSPSWTRPPTHDFYGLPPRYPPQYPPQPIIVNNRVIVDEDDSPQFHPGLQRPEDYYGLPLRHAISPTDKKGNPLNIDVSLVSPTNHGTDPGWNTRRTEFASQPPKILNLETAVADIDRIMLTLKAEETPEKATNSRWIHLQQAQMSLRSLENLITQVSGVDDDDLVIALSLLQQVAEKAEKPYVHGHYLMPMILRGESRSIDKLKPKEPDRHSIFINFPFFSFQAPSTNPPQQKMHLHSSLGLM